MREILKTLFLPNQYIPHGHCYLWQSPLVGLHLVSDLLIALAYFSIPALLLYFVNRRSDTPFPKVFLLFGAFILLCGTGHLLEIWTLWQPIYWLSGIEKAATALVSCYTALRLVELLPQFLALRTPQELEIINKELQAQITASTLAHQELRQSEQMLQAIVAGTASVTGEAFFPALVQNLAIALDAPYILVSELIDYQPQTLRTLAFWSNGQVEDPFTYTLPGNPCGLVVDHETLCYLPKQVQQPFSTAASLETSDAQYYMGAPLLDDSQQVVGVLCIASDRLLSSEESAKAIIKVFAARAAVELLRQRAESALHRAYSELELRVQSRTSELVAANSALESEVQERIVAETALRQQAKHERLVSLITQQIHRSLDLQAILSTTVVNIRQVLRTDRVLIYQLLPDGSGEVVVESASEDWSSLAGTTIHDCYFADTYLELYRQGRTQAVEDIYTSGLTSCHVELLAAFQVKANLAVPIVYDDILWGLLVAQQCGAPRKWPLDEIELLKQLATQAAIAIQKSELYRQAQVEIVQRQRTETILKHQVERERLLEKVSQQIRQSLDLKETLNTTVQGVRHLLQADRVLLYQIQADTTGSVITESVTEGYPAILGQPLPEEIFPQASYQLYQEGRIRRVFDVDADEMSPCLSDTLRQFGVKSKLVVPILQGEELWGLLIAHQCSRARLWEEPEINLLKQLVSQLEIAIQQSKLFEQIQQNNVELEQQIQERTAQLQQALALESALKRITDKVRDSLDEHQILHSAVEELVELLQVDYCNTALYDLEQNLSVTYYEHGRSLEVVPERVVCMGDFPDIYPQLLQGQYLQFCCQISTLSFPALQHRAAIFACPICDEQGVIGDLWLFHEESRIFNELETRLVQQVANQCAIALRQARLYQMAQAQVEELEKLNRLKDDFLSTVSHELRTPMASIKLATHLLERVLKQAGLLSTESSPAARYFKVLQDESQREIELINALLDLARLDAGSEPLVLTTIDARLWISATLEPFEERAISQEQQLQIDIPATLPPLTTDVLYLGQILTELLHNACKYTPAGETIQVAASIASDRWKLSVSNSGVEIPDTECERLFDKFYRVPNNDPWRHGGTGLGLALVKRRVEHLGATIQVRSEAGRLTFTIELPIR